jgi:hypothetical protein
LSVVRIAQALEYSTRQGGGTGYAGQRGREVQRRREVPTVAESRSIKKVAGQFWLKFWWVRG